MAANRYWTGAVDTDWNDVGNWEDVLGGGGPASSVPGAGDTAYFGADHVGNCTLDMNIEVASILFETLSGDYTGTFDADTFDVAVSGDFGTRSPYTLRMGSGAWTVGGDFTARDVTFWGESATLTMTGSGKIYIGSNDIQDSGPKLIVDVGAGITIDAILALLNGIQDKGSLVVANATRTFDNIDVEADATLSVNAQLDFYETTGKTITTFGAGATIDGTDEIRWYRVGAGTYAIPAGTYSCKLGMISDGALAGCVIRPLGNCVFNGDWTFSQRQDSDEIEWDNATNDPDITFNASVINSMLDKAKFTWTKGIGSILFSGSADKDFDFNGEAVEDIEVDQTAGDIVLTGSVQTDSFTATSTGTGSFDPNGQTNTVDGNCTWAAAFDLAADADTMNGCTWDIGGNFTADGQSLKATAGWTLSVTGTAVASGEGAVAHCDASGGTEIDASEGPWTDNGNNTNWDFGAPAGGPFPHHTRRRMRGGMIGMGV